MSNKRLCPNKREQIINYYKNNDNILFKDLAKIYEISASFAAEIINLAGVKKPFNNNFKRRYTINEKVLEKIDTEEKAYWLGFMYADGNNNLKKRTLSIKIKNSDRAILERFKEILGSDAPIKVNSINNINKNWENQGTLSVSSKKVCEDAIKLGLVPNKTMVLKFPTNNQVPNYLIRHFVRGFFDGDGGLYMKSYQIGVNKILYKNRAYFCSTKAFLEKMKEIITEELKIEIANVFVLANGITSTLTISNMQGFTKLLDWLYTDAKIYLKRKYDKYINFKNLRGQEKIKKPKRTLKEKDVLEIRANTKLSYKQLANEYNVHEITIKNIKNKTTWKKI